MSGHPEPALKPRPAAPVPPPGEALVSGRVVGVLILLAAVGFAAFAVALWAGAASRAWQAFLVNLLFWLGVAQGGVVVSAAFYLTQARWGGPAAYRLAEAFSLFLPVGFVLFWGLYFGRTLIFPWVLHPIAQKAAWLNTPFFFARDGAGLLVMTVLSLWFVRTSRRKDSRRWAILSENIKMPPRAIRRLAPAVALAYAAVYSLLGFDLVMSLAPQWRSSLFGAYFFEGAFWSALAAMALVAVVMGKKLKPGNVLTRERVLHDLGKLVFGFSVFWFYLLFAQYIVIWYGDIPVETFFIVIRDHHMPWLPLSWGAFVLIWFLPFTFLMSAQAKKTPAILGTIALLGMVGMWLERYVLVVPSLSPHKVPFGIVELLVTVGFAGLFGLCSLPGMRRLVAEAAAGPGQGVTHE
jgi:hypothetical protein